MGPYFSHLNDMDLYDMGAILYESFIIWDLYYKEPLDMGPIWYETYMIWDLYYFRPILYGIFMILDRYDIEPICYRSNIIKVPYHLGDLN